jgi:hypothetical protein
MLKISEINDDSPVNHTELARVMRVSRSTIFNRVHEGYCFEFGNRTTPGHFKSWLRGRALQPRPISVNKALRRSVLAKMR